MIKTSKFEYNLKAMIFFISVAGIGINLCLLTVNQIFLLAVGIFMMIMGISLYLFVNDDNFRNEPDKHNYENSQLDWNLNYQSYDVCEKCEYSPKRGDIKCERCVRFDVSNRGKNK